MTTFTLTSTTPLSQISGKDRKAINIAYESAFTSDFRSSLQLGACIRHSKGYVLWG